MSAVFFSAFARDWRHFLKNVCSWSRVIADAGEYPFLPELLTALTKFPEITGDWRYLLENILSGCRMMEDEKDSHCLPDLLTLHDQYAGFEDLKVFFVLSDQLQTRGKSTK